MRKRTVQPEFWSFVSVLQSPVTPFDRNKTKNGNCVEECNVFGNRRKVWTQRHSRREKLRCNFLARKSAKLIANFSPTMVTSLPSLSLSSSAPHAQYRKCFRASYNSLRLLFIVKLLLVVYFLNMYKSEPKIKRLRWIDVCSKCVILFL